MMTFQHPYEHSPSQSWRSFPDEYDRPPALPQVPLIPRQPAAFDDHYYSDSDYLYHSQHRQQHTSHSLYPAPPHFEPLHMASGVAHPQPQGWAPETFHAVPQGFSPYEGFPAGSSFPPPRLEPPSLQPRHPSAMAGPLDPGGGVFYRSPEHPRLRTAQACEKCRVRKAKCSGDHPSCKRCMARGLACEYAKEGRTRGPNKTKKQNNSDGPATIAGPSKDAAASRSASKPPTPSTPPMNVVNHLHKEVNKRMSLPTLPRPHRLSLSMGEHRAERPRPPDLRLESHSMLYRLEGDGSSRQVQDVSPRGIHDESRRRVQHDTPRRLHAHSLSAGAVSPGLTPRFPPPGSSGRNLDGLASHDVAPISRRSREGSYDGSSCSSEGIGMYASQDGSGTSSYPSSLRSPLESPGHTGLTYPDDVGAYMDKSGAYMDKSGAYMEGRNAYSDERTAYTHIGGTDLEGGAYTHISNDGGAYTDHAMAYAGWDALPAPQPHSAETFAFAGEQQGWEHGKMEQHEMLDGAHGGIQSGIHNDGGMSLDGGVQHDPMHGGHGDMMHGGPDAMHADALRHDAQFAPGDMAFGGGMSAVGHLGATHPGAAGGQL